MKQEQSEREVFDYDDEERQAEAVGTGGIFKIEEKRLSWTVYALLHSQTYRIMSLQRSHRPQSFNAEALIVVDSVHAETFSQIIWKEGGKDDGRMEKGRGWSWQGGSEELSGQWWECHLPKGLHMA